MEQPRALAPYEFEKIRKLAYEKFGLDLKGGKEELVSARLGKKIREGKFRSFKEYFDHVMGDKTGESLIAMIDALTTNFTSFFREAAHFEFLRKEVLPGLRARPSIDLWCAAASTGEEPYSLAFTMLDVLGDGAAHKIHILATDISTRVLEAASRGVYPAERFQGLEENYLRRHVLKGRGKSEGMYKVRPEVRKLIEYRRLNLIEPIKHDRLYPVIFCRNVMIYFDKPTQEKVVCKLSEWLEPGGHLFIGHSESLTGVSHGLRYVRPALYQKPPAGSYSPHDRGKE